MDNNDYFLALNRMPGIGPRMVVKLLKKWPNLSEMFTLTAQQLIQCGLSEKITTIIKSFDFKTIEADWRWQENQNNYLLTWCDANYPTLLKEIHDPPFVLYATGDLDCLKQPLVAMIGTRKPSVTGAETAWQFAAQLATQGITIVSGLALGIDAQAHRGCLSVAGKTIAVMGTGIDCIYPYRHRQLAEQISDNGLLISEFPLNTSPNAGHFPRRNRIISGLSSTILVVEAAIRSGSLITARLALEQNRDVLAIPGSIYNPQAKGCHLLLQQGARLVTTCDDVLDELGMTHATPEIIKPNLALASMNTNLVKCIGYEITTIEQIIVRSGLNHTEVVCGLAELELAGMVEAVPGGYMRCIL